MFKWLYRLLVKWNRPSCISEQTISATPKYKLEPNVGLKIVTPPDRGKLKIKKKKET